LDGDAVENLWIHMNLWRAETVAILVYVAGGAMLVESPDGSLWLPPVLLVVASILWFLAKMMTSWLTVIVLVILALVPVVGWLVLVGLLLLRLNWFSRNSEAAIASVVIAVLPLAARLVPLAPWQSAVLLAGFATLLLLGVYSSGYSATSMLDVFLTVPAAVIAVVVSVVHVVGDLAGGDHTAGAHKPVAKQPQLEPSSPPADGPALEVVKPHLRTQPDGIAQNNLSYTGPDKVVPSSAKVGIDAYVRTEADGIASNNLSSGGGGSMHTPGLDPPAPDPAVLTADLSSGTWSSIVTLAAVPAAFVGTVGRQRRVSRRYRTALDDFAAGRRKLPRRLRRRTRRRLAALDRRLFLDAMLQPGVSQWQRLKNFLDDSLRDDPAREAAARMQLASLLAAEVAASASTAPGPRS
jgi:hypothetical protein